MVDVSSPHQKRAASSNFAWRLRQAFTDAHQALRDT
jgi:hypothetical protein|tara:strand:+ start:421 stop:528 length:108 start_codon:yes stop_codon:yes gene_type:complete